MFQAKKMLLLANERQLTDGIIAVLKKPVEIQNLPDWMEKA